MSTIQAILAPIRNAATSEADKGARFEELIQQFLLNAPEYKVQFSNVWRWIDYRYIVNGKSALEWIMERYAVKSAMNVSLLISSNGLSI